MKTKDIEFKVLVKMPSKWIDFDSPFGGIGFAVRDRLDKLLRDKVISEVVNKIKLPEIKISQAEVKDRMLDILAKKALHKEDEE